MKILKIIFFFFIITNLSISASRIIDKNEKVRTDYNMKIEYDKSTHSLLVYETIIWKNIDSAKVDSLYLNIPVGIKAEGENYSHLMYSINSFKINNEKIIYKYLKPPDRNFIDSSLICVKLPKGLVKNETANIHIEFKIILPKERNWSDGLFYNFENWYVTVSPLFNGKFEAYSSHMYLERFLEFSNYEVSLVVPETFELAIPGELVTSNSNGMKNILSKVESVSKFNWFLFNNLKIYRNQIDVQSHKINVELFIQQSKDKYVERYMDGVSKYLNSLANYGDYPFNRITIVDIPNAEPIENKSYPGIIAIKTELLSPIRTQKFEYSLALVIAEQYYGNMINSNAIMESWLSKGLSAYIAEKLVRKHYGDLYSYFYIAEYYPIFGLHFMSYAGIPLIYTLSDQVIPEGARYIKNYYDNLLYANMSIPSYQLPNREALNIASIVKPQIAMLTFEKMIGEKNFERKIEKYSEDYLFSYSSANDFLKIITSDCSKEKRTLSNELFRTDIVFDYAVRSVDEYSEGNYEIMLERIEDGVLPITLNIFTELDTIRLKWNGVERFKVFNVSTDSEIISAQIDVEGNNMLDLNIANNSYVVEDQYWGAISYATRVFFWFQNALMLIGGKG